MSLPIRTFQSFYICLPDWCLLQNEETMGKGSWYSHRYIHIHTHAPLCTYRADCWMKSTPVHNFFLEGSDQPITCSNWQQYNKVHTEIIWSNGFYLLICFQSHIWTNLTLLLSQAFVTAHLTHTHTQIFKSPWTKFLTGFSAGKNHTLSNWFVFIWDTMLLLMEYFFLCRNVEIRHLLYWHF